MKQLKLQLKRFSVIQITIILLLFGLFAGILSANIFRDSYLNEMAEYQNKIFTDISKLDIDYKGLFLYVTGKNYKEFVVFWLLSVTILGIPYMAFRIVAFGFSTGFFISAIAIQYGFKGILLVLVYQFPHGLIYLPIAAFCLYRGFYLCRTIYYDKRNFLGTITKQLKQYLPLLLILAILLLLASFLEAYVGSFFLKKTLNLFI
ncbi:MAG TPA: stage II sporulation protein M [Mobilitalea sp.]|nr:stage II sporulation protein M [Mobilitalea sp.]